MNMNNSMYEQDEEYLRMLEWRGIDTVYNGDVVCPACRGSGVVLYGTSTTWRYSAGGQQTRHDVCDQCWGSGKQNEPGVDLRKMFFELRTLSKG